MLIQLYWTFVLGEALGIVMDIDGDGSLGFSLFAGCLLTLDFGTGSMQLEEGALPAIDGERVLSLDMNRGATPAITVQLGEREENRARTALHPVAHARVQDLERLLRRNLSVCERDLFTSTTSSICNNLLLLL